MLIYRTKTELAVHILELKAKNQTVGFVPTMGALHEGHLSLVNRALTENDIVVCSIFVNPTQFNEAEDFENYPKTIDADQQLLKQEGCDILFIPTVEDVYENETQLNVNLFGVEKKMEGSHRPGHFNGVIRVLTQLFSIVQPDKSYFGLKDYQQYLVVKKLADQHGLGGEIVGCETVREPSGLAKSSRNKRLSETQKIQAKQIFASFQAVKKALNPLAELEIQKENLAKFFQVEYLSLCDGETLEEIENLTQSAHIRIFFAGKIGNIRLIDNLRIK